MSKILIFDIETTDLASDWGTLLCFGYKWFGEEKISCPSIMDYKGWHRNILDDSRLVKEVHKVMSQADIWIGYFSKGFDLPWLQGKFLEYGLPVLYNTPHHDLFFVAKSNLRISRKSLDNVTKYLNLSNKKYHVEPAIWKKAKVGDPDAIAKVIVHCIADIQATEELYLKFRPLIRTHTRVNGWAPCRACGSDRLQRRGYAATTLKGERIRVQCQNCGSWETRSPIHAEAAT